MAEDTSRVSDKSAAIQVSIEPTDSTKDMLA